MSVATATINRSGKSVLNLLYGSMNTFSKFQITDQAQVDGATWYTVNCIRAVSEWIRAQPQELRYELGFLKTYHSYQFDIHEKLYTMLALRWS